MEEPLGDALRHKYTTPLPEDGLLLVDLLQPFLPAHIGVDPQLHRVSLFTEMDNGD